jgi:hypothetical protein
MEQKAEAQRTSLIRDTWQKNRDWIVKVLVYDQTLPIVYVPIHPAPSIMYTMYDCEIDSFEHLEFGIGWQNTIMGRAYSIACEGRVVHQGIKLPCG